MQDEIVSQSPKVAIVVDNPRRDLRGLVLLAYQFAKRGAKVFLVPMYQQGYDLPLLAPDLVVVNYARESNRGLLESYRVLGFRVAVLDTEGGVLSESGLDSPAHWAASLRDSGLAALIDDYCFWGEAVHSVFRAHSGMSEAALATTGCPRYDICVKPWLHLLQYPRKGFVLVNTNFSAINPMFTRSAEDEERIFCSQGWDKDYVRVLFAELQAVFPRYLDSIADMARALPEVLVHVRPHPFENDAVYRTRFAGLPNVVIDGEGDIFNAIHEAGCIVHLNCGSSVDAARMGKIPISMEFLNSEVMRRHAPLPSQVSCAAMSPAELLSLVADPTKRAARYEIRAAHRIIEPWYHLSDGKAAQRVTEFLLARLRNSSRHPQASVGAALRGGRPRASLGQYLQGALSLVTGSRMAAGIAGHLQKSRRGKHIALPVVSELIRRFSELDDGPSIVVKPARGLLGQNLSSFYITKS